MQVDQLDAEGHVVGVALQRSAGPNALSMQLCAELQAALVSLEQRPVRAVVLHSTQEHFCVGADLKERRSMDANGLLAARAVSDALTRTLVDLPVPVVGVAHGFTLGGGLELLLHCDVLVADDTAVLGLPESRIGIVPGGGGSQLLARRIDWGRANLLALTGRRVPASDAGAWGLVDLVARAGDGLVTATAVATEIAAGSPRSIRLIKKAMRDGYGARVHDALDIEDHAWRDAALSPDYQTGLAAFAAKQRPVWSD